MELAGRRVLVAGAGVTGTSVTGALVTMGAQVTVTDGNAERLAALDGLGAELVPGLTEPPESTSLVVTSPGWRPSAPLLVAAADADAISSTDCRGEKTRPGSVTNVNPWNSVCITSSTT